ncbi:sigma D regulator [Ketobacter sp.]|uniref:sigma D regulator n=1 Tax=Ketobacter sp. TaxID=2083498 RepID=UPI000F0F0999|nr:sigma D regulator [Ketobacter sp.]RLU00677.1 MAG: sigma D regulator [Ketobacter sp.]
MLTEAKNTTEQWGNIDRMISRWLKERQELIVLYCKVDGLKQFSTQDTPITVRVQALCDVLIDYVSAGHFEIYQVLMKEAEQFNDDYQHTIDRILPLIQQSTELALDFNDQYSSAELCASNLDKLARDLNQLGEKMVERFDLEDKLIDSLHTCHRDMVA